MIIVSKYIFLVLDGSGPLKSRASLSNSETNAIPHESLCGFYSPPTTRRVERRGDLRTCLADLHVALRIFNQKEQVSNSKHVKHPRHASLIHFLVFFKMIICTSR